MLYEDIKESGACFIFYYLGQDGIGQVVIWGKLESDKLTWGKMTCNQINIASRQLISLHESKETGKKTGLFFLEKLQRSELVSNTK